MFAHTSLGFCMWDIPALIVLILIIVIFIVHRHNQKKREEELDVYKRQDETLTISASIKGTDVGTYTTLAEGSEWKVTKGEADVTGNYDITVTGQLTITKAGSAQYQGCLLYTSRCV